MIMDYIPKTGFIGRLLNPHPFNHKEHAAILIMSSTAAHSAMAAEVIAVQRLWYTKIPNAAVCIFLIFSSQCLGYGIAGLMRKIVVYPTKVQISETFVEILLMMSSSSTPLICQSCPCLKLSIGRKRERPNPSSRSSIGLSR